MTASEHDGEPITEEGLSALKAPSRVNLHSDSQAYAYAEVTTHAKTPAHTSSALGAGFAT